MKKYAKRNGLLCVLVAAGLFLGGCAGGQGQMSYIGADTAKQKILDEAGLREDQVKIIGVDMETRNGMDYYQVTFSDESGKVYRYYIEALTGTVIESSAIEETQQAFAENAAETTAAETMAAETTAAETTATETTAVRPTVVETLVAESAPAGTAAAETTAAVRPVLAASSGTPTVRTAQATAAADSSILTAEEAKANALSHAGLSASQVTFAKAELDWDDGRRIYEIEFYGSDRTEYDYEIDAASGAVVKYAKEAPEQPAQPPMAIAGTGGSGVKLSADEAKAKALSQVPGASAADITEFETDMDDGRFLYEGKICYDGMEYEFEIDGYSGAIRNWECEHMDHHDDGHHSFHID